ncbi:hypothetical protein FRC02_001410 [Tulasnella sp. 418]|nr:hypothetical protein FRC02_001410 [Tulasnella sp. 418]
MIEIMLELAVWSESRPQMETAQHAKLIEEKLTEIAAREREQGRSFGFFERTRANLVRFVSSIKSALLALGNF